MATEICMPKNGMELTYWPGRSGLVGEKVKKETYKVETHPGSSYLIANGNGEFVYGEKENRLGIYLCECDWLLLEFEYPLIQGKNTYETYLVDGEEYEEVRKRKIFVESTSATIKVKAGTFKNVVILKDVYGNKYYLAKGIGFLKITGVNGKVLLELSSVK